MQRIPFSRHATEAEFAAVMQIASCFNDAEWRGYPGMRVCVVGDVSEEIGR